jgi:hypothetical protein
MKMGGSLNGYDLSAPEMGAYGVPFAGEADEKRALRSEIDLAPRSLIID